MKITKEVIYKTLIVVGVFWFADFFLHFTGVGESNYYYVSKLMNSLLFAFLFFAVFNYKEHWKKILYSFVFGTWISFYYLISSYSGLIQIFGIYARYSPPPFVIFGITLTPFLWWAFHSLMFYIGIELVNIMKIEK